MKNITFGGIVVLFLVFFITFAIVQMAFERFGVKDPFFPLGADALIATLALFYFPKGD